MLIGTSRASVRHTRRGNTVSCVGPLLLAVVIAVAACTHSSKNTKLVAPKAPLGPSPFAVADPPPTTAGTGPAIGPAGGHVVTASERVVVPVGAVRRGTSIRVLTGRPIGSRSGETFGAPIGVEHTAALHKPLALTWTTHGLTARQLRTAVLARWDPHATVWRPSSIPLTVSGDVLTAQIREFSVWDWIANTGIPNGGQTIGEVTGSRVDAPKCSDAHLPSWVAGVVDPDEDNHAAAIRVCFEPAKNNVVTTRVVDNRTFSQQLVMTSGGQRWAWTWPGREDYGATSSVYAVARAVLDTPTTFLLPTLSNTAVGIGRPAQPGNFVISAAAVVNWRTVLVDLVAFAFDQLTVGGTDNPLEKDPVVLVLKNAGLC